MALLRLPDDRASVLDSRDGVIPLGGIDWLQLQWGRRPILLEETEVIIMYKGYFSRQGLLLCEHEAI